MSRRVTVGEVVQSYRFNFGHDNTPFNEVFGTEQITLAQMQSRLWSHIENRKILIREELKRKTA